MPSGLLFTQHELEYIVLEARSALSELHQPSDDRTMARSRFAATGSAYGKVSIIDQPWRSRALSLSLQQFITDVNRRSTVAP